MTEKAAVVKLNADGEVVSCAKGLDSSECGYVAGAKVCGKCGAMATQMKMNGMGMMPDASVSAPKPVKKKKKIAGMVAMDSEMKEDEDMMDEEDMDMEEEDMDMEEEDMDMEEDAEDETEADMPEDEEEDDSEMYANQAAERKKMRMRRLSTMGYKSADFDDEAFVCSFDRKVYPGGATVCDSCPGGCVSEKGMPALIEIEGIAEDMFRGKVLDSGYSDEADLFVVDVERKDGKPVEIFFDGSTGEVMGWHQLTNDVLQVKSALENKTMISFGEAADIAVKSVEGDIIAVEPDVFEGFDVYAVEIDGINGKSYDVFVSLDGEVLGYDEYTQEEASEIEAEAAEIALKRAYTEESRNAMAKAGQALPDGSYPIKDEADLRNAIQAYGRAKDKTAAKAHIMKRALALGLEDLIPMNWVSKEDMDKAKNESSEKSLEGAVKSEETEFLTSLMEFEMMAVEEGLNQSESE
jgi:uncharacterized membrane protein YkoI